MAQAARRDGRDIFAALGERPRTRPSSAGSPGAPRNSHRVVSSGLMSPSGGHAPSAIQPMTPPSRRAIASSGAGHPEAERDPTATRTSPSRALRGEPPADAAGMARERRRDRGIATPELDGGLGAQQCQQLAAGALDDRDPLRGGHGVRSAAGS